MQINVNSAQAIPRMELRFSPEELKYLEQAKKQPIVYDEDSPETTPEKARRFRRVTEVKAAAGE